MDLLLRIVVGVIVGLIVVWVAGLFAVPSAIANLLGLLAAILVIAQGGVWYNRFHS
jgi:NADH:ubiquinone oxidoreductase subunit F (NADH-binding)